MNTLKKLVLSASLLAMALASTAQAQVTGSPTIVRITGSTAFRAAATQAILSLLGPSNQCAYVNSGSSGVAGANQAIFYGSYTPSGGSAIPLVIKTFWTGSVGGVKSLSQNSSLTQTISSTTVSSFLDNSVITGATAAGVAGAQSVDTSTFPGGGAGILNFKPTGGTNAYPTTAGNWETIQNPPQVADIGFTDAFQNTTLYANANLGATAETVSGAGGIAGLIPFVWVKNAALTSDPDYTAWTHLTNVTPNLIKQLLTNGKMPISLATGNAADYNALGSATLYAIGRDEDSGTRINQFAESYFGVNSAPKQYYSVALGTSPSSLGIQITGNLALFPAQTVQGTPEPLGHSGFSSGGKVAAELSCYGTDTIGARAYFVTNLGLDDATSFLNATSAATGYTRGVALSWNGVPFSVAAMEQGQYSFWGYEHVYYRTGPITAGGQTVSALTGNAQIFADALVTDLATVDQLVASGVPLSGMQVSRTVEGGPITHN